ncbi:MAG: hypothetical protein M1816_007759 [Peltula sp. TS41687]|nr:MAG: hypothetical protein M1816_007759 [Peltula sp. TS41687]
MPWFQSVCSGASSVTAYLLYTITVVTLGPLQFGYHMAELNAPQDVITCEKEVIQARGKAVRLPQCISMTPALFGLVSSIFTLGGLVGALVAGPCSTRYGRVPTMRIMTVFFILGPIFEAAASNISLFSIGRVLSGLGAGAAVVVVPVYISEVSPSGQKGVFGALTQVTINVGILATQALGLFLSRGQKWRIILAVAGAIGVVQLVGLSGVSESPQWLYNQGKPQSAKKVLKRIRSDKDDVEGEIGGWKSDAFGNESGHEEEALLHREGDAAGRDNSNRTDRPENNSGVGVFEILRHPLHRPAVIAVVGVMIAQQFCGVNSIIMYSVSILGKIFPTQSALLTVIISAINLVVTVAGAPLADRIGRKTCLLVSIAAMGTNAALLAISIHFSIRILSAVATLLFVTSYAIGLGPVPFLLPSELVSQDAVGAAQSLALAASWIATFLVAQFFPILDTYLDRGRVFYVFAALAAFFFAFVAWRVPESKDKRDADEVWGRQRRVE